MKYAQGSRERCVARQGGHYDSALMEWQGRDRWRVVRRTVRGWSILGRDLSFYEAADLLYQVNAEHDERYGVAS